MHNIIDLGGEDVIIIAAILIGWGVWNSPSSEEIAEIKRKVKVTWGV